MKFPSSTGGQCRLQFLVLLAAVAAGACSSSTGGAAGGTGGKAGDSGGATGGAGGSGATTGGVSQWTTMGFDVQSTFHNTAETKITKDNVGQLTQLWSRQLTVVSNGNALNSSVTGTPVVMGKRLYVGTGFGTQLLDADTGVTTWGNSDSGTTSSGAYDNGVIYSNSNGVVVAVDAETGATKWTSEPYTTEDKPAGFGSAIVVGDYVVVGMSSAQEYARVAPTFRGGVAAFHKVTGKAAWTSYTVAPGETGATVWGTPSADPDAKLVFAATGNNYAPPAGTGSDAVFAFDLTTGAEKWRQQVTQNDIWSLFSPKSSDSDFGANPVVLDYKGQKLVAAGQKSGSVYVFNRADGTKLWDRKFGNGSPASGGVFQALSFDGERILVVSNMATSTGPGSEPLNKDVPSGGGVSALLALDPLTGDIIWERQLPNKVWNPITIANGVGFIGIQTKLQAFDVVTGDKLFEFQTTPPASIGSGISIVDGRVYFGAGFAPFTGGALNGNSVYALALP
jgi:polyvinyl alcohol dehydrogenase (cytochrome)